MLVAMSGGVDSSVAAARLLAQGHEVTGVTLKLWGGDSDSGCCSVSDATTSRFPKNASLDFSSSSSLPCMIRCAVMTPAC